MRESIEDFLGLTPQVIHDRVVSVLQNIPTRPGTGYIDERLKEFHVQPWPFLTYMASYHPGSLRDGLERYACYDGTECSAMIMEKLREYHIFCLIKAAAIRHKKDVDKDTEPDLILRNS